MQTQDEVIEVTAQEVIAKLAHMPADARVRVMIGRPSLSVCDKIARRLQATAGMTEEIHDELLKFLINEG